MTVEYMTRLIEKTNSLRNFSSKLTTFLKVRRTVSHFPEIVSKKKH